MHGANGNFTVWCLCLVIAACVPRAPSLVPAEWAADDAADRSPAIRQVLVRPESRAGEIAVRFTGVELLDHEEPNRPNALVFSLEARSVERISSLQSASLDLTLSEGRHQTILGRFARTEPLAPGAHVPLRFPLPPEVSPLDAETAVINLVFESPEGEVSTALTFVGYRRRYIPEPCYGCRYQPFWDDVYVVPTVRHRRAPVMGPPKDPH